MACLWLDGKPICEVSCVGKGGGESDKADVSFGLAADVAHAGDNDLQYGTSAHSSIQLLWIAVIQRQQSTRAARFPLAGQDNFTGKSFEASITWT